MSVGTKVEPLTSSVEETKGVKTSYVRELKEELQKVTWTTREELILCTKVVVISTFMFGMGIYIADLSIKGVLQGVAKIVHLIFG